MKTELIIGVVDKIHFKANPLIHTVYYDKNARQATSNQGKEFYGTFKAAIGTFEEVKENLRLQIKEYLEKGWWKLNPTDFEFDFQYSTVENGNFWITPCISRGGRIPVDKAG